jgi:polar amino acid transport system substrate-binding protein
MTSQLPPLHGPRGESIRAAIRRRWLWILLVTVLVAGLAATQLARTITRPRDPFWERIQSTDTWRVAMDASFPPFETLDEAGQPVGFDVDLARAIAQRWGVDVQIEGIGFDGLVDAVWASRVDAAISALPYQPHLTRDVWFSQPYFEAGLVLVTASATTRVRSVDDLTTERVAVEWGSEGDVQARALRRRFPGLEIVPRPSAQDALTAVVDGDADAALVDRISALETSAAGHDRLWIAPQAVVSDPYVIVLPRKAPVLQQQVAEALRALEADGTLAHLGEKWLGAQ